jgi:CubicO group peptidase (beta-lactamase class C family)
VKLNATLTSTALCTALIAGCHSQGNAAEVDDPSQPPPCTTDLTPELAKLRVPGIAAAIVKHGKVVCTAVAGMANIEENQPVTPDTVFWWASVSKPVAATAAMSVWEQGKFKLEDEVNAYIPFQVKHPNPACDAKHITFQELLTHTSSIFEDEDLPPYKDAFVVGMPREPLGQYLQDYLLPGGRLYSTSNFVTGCPGEQYNYSSIGYGLLGFTIESIIGESFDRICMDRVFKPLELKQTSFTLADLDISKLAMPYSGDSAANFKALGHREHANYPDGSLRSSVLELSRFLLMSMNFGEYEGKRILMDATVKEMFRPQLGDLPGGDGQGYAWYHDRIGTRDVIGHDGDDPGARSLMFFDPADGAGVLLVVNGEWSDGDADLLFYNLFAESSNY